MAPPRTVALGLLAAAVLLPILAAPAGAHVERVVEFTVEARDDGAGSFWYTFNATGDARNPAVLVPPGTRVRLDLVINGTIGHNIHVDESLVDACHPGNCRTAFLTDRGDRAALSFVVPDDAPERIPYWCDPHRGQGMSGLFVTSQAALEAARAEADGARETPAPSVVAGLAALAAAGLLRRR